MEAQKTAKNRHQNGFAASPKKNLTLSDFSRSPRLLPISALAIAIGIVSAFIALALLRLMGLFTNLFYFHRWGTELTSPKDNTLGLYAVLVPIAGALVIGVMARYGSEKIRGHGIPEAMEAILLRGSRVEPKVAVLKPISAAISIGSGGPFGAEGPIIMTGGAFGSIVAQLFNLTSAERKTLLVSGAAAGMAAVFSSPLAATLLGVELLLFEWKPRSFVPVALASAAAATTRPFLLGDGPLFHVTPHLVNMHPSIFAAAAACGLFAAVLAALLTLCVYAAEDLFHKLPIHWMWWPALGGLVIGIGGLIEPRALGVGYETIDSLLHGDLVGKTLVVLIVVKGVIWSVSLGSGTSGGVLAPLLMMGAALGVLEGGFFPEQGVGFWALISMAAVLGSTMGSPLMAIVFAVEVTHDYSALVPLLIACAVAHAFTSLVVKRGILTEKIARRGYHVTREYAIDPLEILFVREVMSTEESDLQDVAKLVDSNAVALPNEPLTEVVYRMARRKATRLVVVSEDDPHLAVGVVTLEHLLQARTRHIEEEERRQRHLTWTFMLPMRARRPSRIEPES